MCLGSEYVALDSPVGSGLCCQAEVGQVTYCRPDIVRGHTATAARLYCDIMGGIGCRISFLFRAGNSV